MSYMREGVTSQLTEKLTMRKNRLITAYLNPAEVAPKPRVELAADINSNIISKDGAEGKPKTTCNAVGKLISYKISKF